MLVRKDLTDVPGSVVSEVENKEDKNVSGSTSASSRSMASVSVFSSTSLSSSEFKVFRSNTHAAVSVHGALPFQYIDDSYEMLTHDLPITPASKVSCRGASRESILLDMQSVTLKSYFNEFMREFLPVNEDSTQPLGDSQEAHDELQDKIEAKEVKSEVPAIFYPNPFDLNTLETLVKFVKTKFYLHTEADISHQVAKMSMELVSSLQNRNVAPLEWFLESHVGCCRHQVLVVSYLLVSLIDHYARQSDKTFVETQSKVYRFRTGLQLKNDPQTHLSHAVVIYEAENGHRYLLDPTITVAYKDGVAVDLTTLSSKDRTKLVANYRRYNLDVFLAEIGEVYHSINIGTKQSKQVSNSKTSSEEPAKKAVKRPVELDESVGSVDSGIAHHKRSRSGH